MKLCMGCMEQYEEKNNVCPQCNYAEGTPPEERYAIVPGTILNDRYIVGKLTFSSSAGIAGYAYSRHYIGWDGLENKKVTIKEYTPFHMLEHRNDNVVIRDTERFNKGKERLISEASKMRELPIDACMPRVNDVFECVKPDFYDCFCTVYIVMDYNEGIYLSEIIEEKHTLSVDKTLEMLLPFIKSMILLQSYGIVNTNVTPFNIWITGNSTLKLIDFIDIQFSLSTAHRSIFLPWEYYPDEILNPKGRLGLYTDVFSLAVTMYRMITTKRPQDTFDREMNIKKYGTDTLLPISFYVPEIKENIEIAILNALNIYPEDRTPNMETFYKELISETPIERRPQLSIKQNKRGLLHKIIGKK